MLDRAMIGLTLLSGVHICAKFVQYRGPGVFGLAAADKSADAG